MMKDKCCNKTNRCKGCPLWTEMQKRIDNWEPTPEQHESDYKLYLLDPVVYDYYVQKVMIRLEEKQNE